MKRQKLILDKKDKLTILAVSVSMLLFAVLVKLSGISVSKIVLFQNQLLKLFLGGGTEIISLALILPLLSAFLFLVLALAFLSSYGTARDEYRVGMISGIISAVIVAFVLPSIPALVFGISLIIAFSYIVSLSNTYFMELKKWKFFRTGSHAAGRALLIINLGLVLGIFISVNIGIEDHKIIFKEDLTNAVSSAALAALPIESPELKNQIEAQVEGMVEGMPLFQSFIKWLPFLTAFSAWIFLEFMRSLVLSNICGVFTAVLIRKYQKS